MALYNIFFSPTGGTQKAALALAQGMGEDWKTIDLSLPRVDYSQVALWGTGPSAGSGPAGAAPWNGCPGCASLCLRRPRL